MKLCVSAVDSVSMGPFVFFLIMAVPRPAGCMRVRTILCIVDRGVSVGNIVGLERTRGREGP